MFIWMPPTKAPVSREGPDKEPEKPQSTPTKAIRDFPGLPLYWVPVQEAFELRCGEEVLAIMRYEQTSLWGPWWVVAQTTEGSWSFWSNWGQVAIFEGDRKLAALGSAFWGFGSRPWLSLPSGDNYLWQFRERSWTVEAHWGLTADGSPLVSFKAERRFLKGVQGKVEVQTPAAALPELDLLITLGWYLVVRALQHTGGGG
jgi:hypothetical protein